MLDVAVLAIPGPTHVYCEPPVEPVTVTVNTWPTHICEGVAVTVATVIDGAEVMVTVNAYELLQPALLLTVIVPL